MATLRADRIAELLQPYGEFSEGLLIEKLSVYLDLLLKWNARTNLTAIVQPEQIVQRHFGESLFAVRHIPATARTLLDVGSGAGFPGVPIQLALPKLEVTLAESQHKKASFLREITRELQLRCEIWPDRVEDLITTRRFDVVTMRAVDRPEDALRAARARRADKGVLIHLTTCTEEQGEFPIPQTDRGVVRLEYGASANRDISV